MQTPEEFAFQWWNAIYTGGWTAGLALITARDAEIAAEAARVEREAVIAVIDGGSFLHDKAPGRLFANEVIAAIRRVRP